MGSPRDAVSETFLGSVQGSMPAVLSSSQNGHSGSTTRVACRRGHWVFLVMPFLKLVSDRPKSRCPSCFPDFKMDTVGQPHASCADGAIGFSLSSPFQKWSPIGRRSDARHAFRISKWTQRVSNSSTYKCRHWVLLVMPFPKLVSDPL